MIFSSGISEPQSGSLSLSLLASVMGGLLATLLFANLTRYVVARNALQSSVEKVARCLSPTDSTCLKAFQTPQDSSPAWFAKQRTTIRTDWTDRYNYSARLREQTWEVSGSGYEIHLTQRPPVTWLVAELPRKTFRATLNRYETRAKQIAAQVMAEFNEQHYRVPAGLPVASDYFPAFDETYETTLDERPISAWSPRVLIDRDRPSLGFKNFHELTFSTLTLPSQTIRAGESAEFHSEFIEVPTLLSESPGVTCLDGRGRNCSILPFAGSAGIQGYSWQTYAALAIKPFAELEAMEGSPQVAWAGAPGSEGKHWGLQVEIIPAADFQNYRSAVNIAIRNGSPLPPLPKGEIRCLGGRTLSNPLSGKHPFHLWLRGAKGANGGGEPNCPSAQNALYEKHDSLFVQRGGAFRISGFLSVQGSGRINARVSFKHYFDSYEPYQRTVERETSCTGSFLAERGEQDSHCDAALACPSLRITKTRGCRILSVTKTPLCIGEKEAQINKQAHLLPPILCGTAIQGPVCADSEKPTLAENCEEALRLAPDRISCGWQEATHAPLSDPSRVEVPFLPQDCPLAITHQKEAPCDTPGTEVLYQSSGDYGVIDTCSNLPSVRQHIAETLEALSRESVPGLASSLKDGRTDYQFASPHSGKDRWAPALSLPEELRSYLGDETKLRTGIFRIKNISPLYRHRHASWIPPLSAFGFYDSNEKGDALQFSLMNEESKEIMENYPFRTKPEFEIPKTLPGECREGSAHEAPAPLAIRLRAYAQLAVPALSDEEIELETSADYIDSLRTARRGSCSPTEDFSLPVPPCTTVHYQEVQSPLCHQRLYLGNFPKDLFPQGPPVCLHSSFSCFEENVTQFSLTAAPSELDTLAAQAKGLEELQKAFPYSTLACAGASCANFEIASDDASHISVRGSYSLPLSFPLNVLLGEEALRLQKEKTEVREQSVLESPKAFQEG